MTRNSQCILCDRSLGPILAESKHWRLVLNRNQDLLGKCFLALRRHCELVTEVTLEEWSELHGQLSVATHALRRTFNPDHFNYAFLQNQDRHVHLHVIPRYATQRDFAGEVFSDADYPDHYAVGGDARMLATGAEQEMAEMVRQAVREVQRAENFT